MVGPTGFALHGIGHSAYEKWAREEFLPGPQEIQRLPEKRSRSVLFSLVLGLILRLRLPRSLILLFFQLFLLILEGLQFLARLIQVALVHFDFFLQIGLFVFGGFLKLLFLSCQCNRLVVRKNR